MTKFTFANKNVVVVESYKPGMALPAKAPTLKGAAKIALEELRRGELADSSVNLVENKGELTDVFFEKGAILTVPSDYTITGYRNTLEVVFAEIAD